MMQRFNRHTLAIGIASVLFPGMVAAQAAPPAQPIATRPLGPILARSHDSLGAVVTVRALSTGGAVVNDVSKRRLMYFDSTLTKPAVIADSAPGATSYGSRPNGLISYRGDSTLFVDALSSSFLVVDPTGKVARVMSAPRTQDVSFLAAPLGGVPAIDPKNRLMYRGIGRNNTPIQISASGVFMPPTPPDSAPILRVDLSTRKLDTVVWIKIPKQRMNPVNLATGGFQITSVLDPLPMTEEWALLSDGSVAVVKRDYHVEVLNADGTRVAGPKLLFDWERLSDEDRVAVIDSVRKVDSIARALAAGARAAAPPTGTAAAAPPPLPPMMFLPNELPDYRPAFKAGSVRGDAEGNLWIQTTAPKPGGSGGLLVDVINKKGELIDRIELPKGRLLAAIGPNGTVYLTARDPTGLYLERARIR